MKTLLGTVASIGLLSVCASVESAERVAEVVSVQGQGESRSGETSPWKPAVVEQELFALDSVRTGAYGRMDFLSRDRYRQAVEDLADGTGEGQLRFRIELPGRSNS